MDPRREAWLAVLRQGLRWGTLLAVLGLVADFGLPLGPGEGTALRVGQLTLIGLFVLDRALRVAWAERRWSYVRARLLEVALAALVVVDVGLDVAQGKGVSLGGTWFYGIQLYLVGRFALGLSAVQSWIARRGVRPALFLLASYALAALAGAGLLLLPRSRALDAAPWSFTEAFFTSTSAVCVTGLSVRDVSSGLSLRGQGALLLLIQLGGLGLVVIVCAAGLAQRGRLALREGRMLAEAVGLSSVGRVRAFLGFAIGFTLAAEALGALGLWWATAGDARLGEGRAWWAVFHSVSAFCNAGFALSPAGLAPWAGDAGVLGVVMALIVLGGLGFGVHRDVLALRPFSLTTLRRVRWRFRAVFARLAGRTVFLEPAPHRLTLSTRIVLRTSAALLILGTLLAWASESGGLRSGLATGERWLESLFLSVSARTAGFQTFDLALAAPPTLLVLIALMAVGASPLSTGGGVKTTTLAIGLLTVRAMARGRDDVDALGRRLPTRVVQACVAIVALYGLLVVLVTAALLVTQEGARFEEVVFESVSALSTVGLSTGLTPRLDDTGRWIVCAAMIAGRIGPLSCLWSFLSRPDVLRYRYPEENVLVS